MPGTDRPTVVDLFCGAGGMSLGLGRAGFEIVLAADVWKPAADTYRSNFPTHTFAQVDLGTWKPNRLLEYGLMPRQVDLVAGGPPCQGFSIQRIGPDEDPRNHLVLRFGELVSWLQPRMFVMENVPGLLGKRGHELAVAFETAMRKAGYDLIRSFAPTHALKSCHCDTSTPTTLARAWRVASPSVVPARNRRTVRSERPAAAARSHCRRPDARSAARTAWAAPGGLRREVQGERHADRRLEPNALPSPEPTHGPGRDSRSIRHGR